MCCGTRWWRARLATFRRGLYLQAALSMGASSSTLGKAVRYRRCRRCTQALTWCWEWGEKVFRIKVGEKEEKYRRTASSRTQVWSPYSRLRRRSEAGRQDRPPRPPLPSQDVSAGGVPVENGDILGLIVRNPRVLNWERVGSKIRERMWGRNPLVILSSVEFWERYNKDMKLYHCVLIIL
jgi:hypothetical protein